MTTIEDLPGKARQARGYPRDSVTDSTYCTRCGVPWHVDHLLQDIVDPDAEGFTLGRHRLLVDGCPCCKINSRRNSLSEFRAAVFAAADALGDDLAAFLAEIEKLASDFALT